MHSLMTNAEDSPLDVEGSRNRLGLDILVFLTKTHSFVLLVLF